MITTFRVIFGFGMLSAMANATLAASLGSIIRTYSYTGIAIICLICAAYAKEISGVFK